GPLSTAFGLVAVTCSSTNVVGGFLITDRMLRMFKREQDRVAGKGRGRTAVLATLAIVGVSLGAILSFHGLRSYLPSGDMTQALKFCYILSAALFILGLKGLSSPRYARRGMFLAEFGMVMAVVGTLLHPAIVTYRWIALGL